MPDISRILCPVDFSDSSTHAVDQAIAVAGWYKARIVALHVLEPLARPVQDLPVAAVTPSETDRQRARDQTAACFGAATAAGIGVDVTVEVGTPAAAIAACAVDRQADLIVMGTHGAGGFERLLLGSVTEEVLRKAPCAIMSVPPRAQATSRLPFRQLLCAVDFSDCSLKALDLALSLARESGAALTLLHVLEWPWHEPPPPAFEELPRAQAAALIEYRRHIETTAMGRLAALVPAGERGQGAVTPRVRHGKPYAEALREAAVDGADLIVVGVHGRNALDLLVFGSTTNHIVRQATCPVLTVRQ